MSSSLRPHGLQHARLFCPALSPGGCSDSCPLSQYCHSTISSSANPFSFCLPSFLLLESFPMNRLFTSGDQSIGTSALSRSNDYSRLICLRIDWFDLLAVQGTLKSLLQHHNSKASIIQCFNYSSVQFSSFQSPSCAQLFVTPLSATCQASLSITNSWSLLKLVSIKLVMPYNHLVLYHPLLLSPSIFPSIRDFSNESLLRTRWPKYWSFSFSISPSNEYSGLISFRIDWLCIHFKSCSFFTILGNLCHYNSRHFFSLQL